MSDLQPRKRRKPAKNTHITKSGKAIKLNSSFSARVKAGREAKAQRKAAYLSTLPKKPWKRILYRMHPKRVWQYWFSRDGAIMALKITGISFVVVFLLIVGLFAYFRKDLPKIKDINSSKSGGSIAYYDRTGKVLLFQDYDTFKRIPVQSDGISKYMKDATVAIEDKDFYHEGAFNVKGITRAAVNNLKGGSTQGGSTITQQLVKLNFNWVNDHTVSRKVKELILAVELEREYSKDDILTAYLNTAPYSGLDSGVQAASQDYFHVDASQLTLAQASLLAAIPKSPTSLSPYASPAYNTSVTDNYFDQTGLLGRQQYILDQMAKQGLITTAQATEAKQVNVLAQVQQRAANHYAGIKYPYFYQAASVELQRDFPRGVITEGGLTVTTTLDVNLQNLAEKSMADSAAKLKAAKADDAAFVSEDNATGQVVALVGGTNFDTQKLNFASSAQISPGSSIKPYSYATLINDNNNVGAGSMLYDTQGLVAGYACTNPNSPDSKTNPGNCLFDDTRRYYGTVTLRYALGSSLNVPAVKAFTSTDPTDTSVCTVSNAGSCRSKSIKNTMSSINSLMDSSSGTGYKCYAKDTELSSASSADEVQCGSAAGIGNEAYTTLANHVNGIASLARMGQAIPQTYILKVTNASNKTIKEFVQPKAKQVIKQDSAYIVTNMASDPGASYLTGRCTATDCSGMKFHRYKGWQIAIKTGTNEDLDGLMMSWNSKYTSGVWIGNYNRSAYGGSPENVTDPIMKEYTQGSIDNLGAVKPTNWTQPADIKTAAAFHSAVPFTSQSAPPSTDLFPSWYAGGTKTASSTGQTLDKVSGKVATSCTPDLAKQVAYNSNATVWNVDIYKGGSPNTGTPAATTTTGTQPSDDVHSCSDTSPSATITAINGTPTGGAVTPNCPVAGCTVLVHVEQGNHPLTDSAYPSYPGTLNIIVNGQTVQSQAVNDAGDYQLTYVPPAGTSGSIQIQAQVTDSVLYSGSDTKTLTVSTTSAFQRQQTTSGAAGSGDDNQARSLVAIG